MTATTVSPETQPSDRLSPDLLKLALVVIVGTFVVQMDATMVNVALDTLRRQFDTTLTTIQWISTAYLMAMAMVIPPAGWAVDRFGAKRVWMTALTLFLAGSVLCGLAWSPVSLIAFRVVQGIGGGILLPLSQAILAQAAGEKRMGRLMAVVGIPSLLGPVLGPVVGGLLVDDLGWRWIFYINVPICLIGLVLSATIMPNSAPAGRSRLDVLGLALLSPAFAGIVYGLSQAGGHGTFADRHVLIPLSLGGVLLLGFVAHALRPRIEPIIDVRLLRSRDFAASSALLFLIITALLGGMLLLPLYYQMVRGQTALHAGMLVAPQGLGAAVAIALCARLVDRGHNPRAIAVVGVLLTVTSTLLYTQIGTDTSLPPLGAVLVLRGAGFGAVVVPATAAAYRGLRPDAIPRATSAMRIFQQLGGSFGVAVLAVVLQRHLTQAAITAPAGHVNTQALAHAFAATFWWAVAFAAAALIPALLLHGRRSSTPQEHPTTDADPRPTSHPSTTAIDRNASKPIGTGT